MGLDNLRTESVFSPSEIELGSYTTSFAVQQLEGIAAVRLWQNLDAMHVFYEL